MTSYLTTESIEPDEECDDTMDDSGVTYFVDDDGRYYYQPNSAEGDSGIVALDAETVPQVIEEPQPQPMENLIVPDTDGNFTQTVTLVPSENADGEVTYVLVVADDNKDLVNLNINMETEQNEEQNLTGRSIARLKLGFGPRTSSESFVSFNMRKKTDEVTGIQEVHIIQEDDENEDPTAGQVILESKEKDVGIEEAVEEQEEEPEAEPGDVYKFEDDDEGSEEEEEEEEDTKTKKKRLRSHIYIQNGNQSRILFTCTFCQYNSHRRYLLIRHMKSHSEERPYKCAVCERGFKTQASLHNHINMHNGVKPHSCNYCKSTFTTSGELVRHVRYKHTHEKPHKCSECDYASVELSKLRRHVRCHTGERPYQCPHCTYASPDTFKLKRHLRTHTGEKPYKCDQCTLCFTQSNSLKAHKLIHNVDEKPVFACELCPAKCGRKTDLRIHVQKLHTSETPLKCKRCGKSFPDRYSCKIHNKTHEGEKCFKCELCPYASTTMRHLKSHLLKHTDEKPFACDHCDQTFRQKQLLRRHQNLYHNPTYKPKTPKEKNHCCPSCERTFAHKGNLMRHLAVHDPDSGHLERALALKLGRQKKVKYIDADALKHPFLSEIKTEGENSNMLKVGVSSSLKRGELVTVSDGDGQQYVVLEVIQLEDGTEQQVAVVAPDFLRATQMREEDMEYGEEVALDDDDEDEEDRKYKRELMQQQMAVERTMDMEKDVVTCFGFDEEEEEEEESATTSASITEKLNGSIPPRHSTVFEVCDDEDSDEDSGNEEEIIYEIV